MAGHRWVGRHAYHDHANDKTIEPGEELPEEIAERVAGAHPRDVEAIEDGGDESDDIEWSEEAWLEGDYSERADAVADGRVDNVTTNWVSFPADDSEHASGAQLTDIHEFVSDDLTADASGIEALFGD